jgi:probable aminopeptidase NPEPL1
MHIKFLTSTAQILPKKGPVCLIGSAKSLQGGLLEKLLPASVPDLFKEVLKTPKLGQVPTTFSTLTGLASPQRVVLGILPEKVAKDNTPTRREWIFQLLDTLEAEEYASIVLCLEDPEHYGAAITAVARQL